MFKSVGILLVLLLVLQGVCVNLALALDDGAPEQVRVTANKLNVRAGPGTENAVLASVPSGTVLEFVGRQGDWTQVRLADGTLGWTASKFLEEIATSEKPAEQMAREPEPERRAAAASIESSGGGGGSALGSVLKWGCLIGALAGGALAYTEHSKGNDSYDEYTRLFDTDQTQAETKYDEAADHDSKALTYGIVGGGLFGLFLLQQFVLGGDEETSTSSLETPTLPIAWDPSSGQARLAVVTARF